jgi:hypothetical protein
MKETKRIGVVIGYSFKGSDAFQKSVTGVSFK